SLPLLATYPASNSRSCSFAGEIPSPSASVSCLKPDLRNIGRLHPCLQYVSKILVDSWTFTRIHVDKPIRSKSPSGKAKQQKGVRCRMFNLVAELGFESRQGHALLSNGKEPPGRLGGSRAVARRTEPATLVMRAVAWAAAFLLGGQR